MRAKTGESAKIFVVNPEGRILTLQRSLLTLRRPRTWDIPGGRLKPGECPDEGIVREVEEETGLELDAVVALDSIGYVKRRLRRECHVTTHLFRAVVESPDPVIHLSTEHRCGLWLPPAEFVALNMPHRYRVAARHNFMGSE
jgi:8-oxo-dGTP diphosphatase